jgi:hypothetical protein
MNSVEIDLVSSIYVNIVSDINKWGQNLTFWQHLSSSFLLYFYYEYNSVHLWAIQLYTRSIGRGIRQTTKKVCYWENIPHTSVQFISLKLIELYILSYQVNFEM